MKVYYFFLVPIMDTNIEMVTDSSLNGIRIEQGLLNTMKFHFDQREDIKYFLLKSVDKELISIDFDTLESVMSTKGNLNSSRPDIMNTVLSCFETECYQKYIAIAQYPLLVVRMHKRQLNIYPPKDSMALLNHCALHFYQFLNVKQYQDQVDRLNSIIQLSDKNYIPGLQSGIKFATCCVHNLLIEMSSRRFFILKHNCQRIGRDKFDNRLCQSVTQLFS